MNKSITQPAGGPQLCEGLKGAFQGNMKNSECSSYLWCYLSISLLLNMMGLNGTRLEGPKPQGKIHLKNLDCNESMQKS